MNFVYALETFVLRRKKKKKINRARNSESRYQRNSEYIYLYKEPKLSMSLCVYPYIYNLICITLVACASSHEKKEHMTRDCYLVDIDRGKASFRVPMLDFCILVSEERAYGKLRNADDPLFCRWCILIQIFCDTPLQ